GGGRQAGGAAPPPAGAAPPTPADAGAASGAASATAGSGAAAIDDTSRSDDYITGDGPTDIEQAFDELETRALLEIARFQEQYEQERREPVAAKALRIVEDCFASQPTTADREALSTFI